MKDPSTKIPILRILALFTQHEYLETLLSSFHAQYDLGENSRLTFFTSDIVVALPPLRHALYNRELTDEEKNLCNRMNIQNILKALQDISTEKMQLLKDFFMDNSSARSNANVITQMIYWFNILDTNAHSDILKRILVPVRQWSGYTKGPFSYSSPLYQNLRQVEDSSVRRQILSIFLKFTFKGEFTLHHLTQEFCNNIIPTLAKLPLEERMDIENFFTPEIIAAVKGNEIFLQVLDRLTRSIIGVTPRRKNQWSEKIVTEITYGHYTRSQRQLFMETLTPEFLAKFKLRGFHELIESNNLEKQ